MWWPKDNFPSPHREWLTMRPSPRLPPATTQLPACLTTASLTSGTSSSASSWLSSHPSSLAQASSSRNSACWDMLEKFQSGQVNIPVVVVVHLLTKKCYSSLAKWSFTYYVTVLLLILDPLIFMLKLICHIL